MYSYKLNYIPFITVFTVVCFPSLTTGSCIIQKKNYSVVLEAKKLQTRAFVYGFLSPNGSSFNITNPFYEANMNGFYLYEVKPDAYFESLKELISRTKAQVPSMNSSETPLTFVASGVGNLTNVTGFLYNVSKCLNTTGFELGNGSVSTLHGRRKLYSWISVNLLLGRFKNGTNSTAAVLDLGTGSSHDEFEITPNYTFTKKTKQKRQAISNVTICGKHYNVSGTSTHGLGLDEARVGILMMGNITTKKVTTLIRIGNKKEMVMVSVITPCFHPNVTTSWTHKDISYYIQGAPSNSTRVNMTACRLQADSLIKNHTKGQSMYGKEVYAMAYYHTVLQQANIVSFGESKNITVQQIEQEAKKVCEKPYPTTTSLSPVLGNVPFTCMDLIYVHELLMQFYQLRNESWIDVVFKLYGITVDWTLGIAYERYKSQTGLLADIDL